MIYLITRSYFPYDNSGGGLARYSLVNFLKENGFKVKIIRVGKKNSIKSDEYVFRNPLPTKVSTALQRIGLINDY